MNHTVQPAQLELRNGIDGPERVIIRPVPAEASNPIHCRQWDLGSPDVRYTAVPNPGADGVLLSPGFLGSRTVTLELQIVGDPNPDGIDRHDAYWWVMLLTRMTHPSANPVLIITRNDEGTGGHAWYMQLRGNPYSITYQRTSAAVLEMQMTFLCPGGFLEGALKTVGTSDIEGDTPATDWIFDAIFPKGFGLVSGEIYPETSFEIHGDAAVSPVVYINGPCTDPEILSSGPEGEARFAFDGLTIEAGQSVMIDMATGDVRLSSGLDDMSVYNYVDWAVSTYWLWQPGIHTLVFQGTSGYVTAQYSEKRFTI